MRIATMEDQNLVIKILSESFAENKSVLFVVNNNKRKIPFLMKYSFKRGMKEGGVFLNDQGNAVIISLYPKKINFSWSGFIMDAELVFRVIGITRIFKILSREKIIKSKQPKSDFIHLWYIGVANAHQGSGLGSRLLEEFIDYEGHSNRPIYLETSTRRNLSFYRRNGFEIVSEIKKELPYTLYMFMRR